MTVLVRIILLEMTPTGPGPSSASSSSRPRRYGTGVPEWLDPVLMAIPESLVSVSSARANDGHLALVQPLGS